jgi:hypothetical protein
MLNCWEVFPRIEELVNNKEQQSLIILNFYNFIIIITDVWHNVEAYVCFTMQFIDIDFCLIIVTKRNQKGQF